MMSRGTAEPLAFAQEPEPNRPAGGGEMARRGKPVAAIVAGAAQNRDRPHRPAPLQCIGNRPPGCVHQHGLAHPSCNCRPVGQGHFGWRQQGIVEGAHRRQFRAWKAMAAILSPLYGGRKAAWRQLDAKETTG